MCCNTIRCPLAVLCLTLEGRSLRHEGKRIDPNRVPMSRQCYIWGNLHRCNSVSLLRSHCTCSNSHQSANGDRMGRGNLSYAYVNELREKKRNAPGGYHTVIADQNRPDPPLHAIRTAGRQRGEVLIWSKRWMDGVKIENQDIGGQASG